MTSPLWAAGLLAAAVQPAAHAAAIAHWRELLSADEFKDERRALIAAAPGAIDQYEWIINAPDSWPMHVSRLYSVISQSNVDRKRFLKYAVRDLANPELRLNASYFIGKVGSAVDSAPLLVLLSDPDGTVPPAAALALGKIGDDRTVIALELWLRYNRVPGDPRREMPHVTKARDDIKARLAAKSPPAKKAAHP